MEGSMDVRFDGWKVRWMEGSMDGRFGWMMDGRIDGWKVRWEGSMDGMDGRIDDGWMV